MSRPSLAIAALLVAFPWPISSPAESDPPRIVLQDFRAENSFVVTPGETRTLRTRIQNANGSGISGVSVIFGAPTEGPSGTFAGATGPSGSFIRVETDASGDAAADITTNEIEGVFEVGIAVEGFEAFSQYSFTNIASLPSPAATTQEIRDTVLDQRLGPVTLGPDVQLHGPVFVPAGSLITAPGEPDPARQDFPVAVARDSWLMWIDEAPGGFFAHEAQWILLDIGLSAQEAVAAADVYPVRWYPTVVPPARDAAWPLLYPANSHPEAFNPDLLPEITPISPLRVAQALPSDACIIAIRGPGLKGAQNDIHNYIRTITGLGLVSSDRVFTNGFNQVNVGADNVGTFEVSTADIQRLVAHAVSAKCKKVYFLMSSHGLDVHHGGGVITTDRGRSNPLSFEDYANILSGLKDGAPGAELCLYQSSCYAGQISQWLWGLGLNGSVVTPADEDHMAWESPAGFGSLYLLFYLQAKTTTAADKDGDGMVSDSEAAAYVAENVSPSPQTFGGGDMVERIFGPNPTVNTIPGNPNVLGLWMGSDNPYLPLKGSKNYICIRRPRSMPDDQEFNGKLTINNAKVAANRFFDPDAEGEDGAKANEIDFKLSPGQKEIKIPIIARGCGITRYRFSGKAGGKDFSGTGRIQVGHFSVLDPEAPRPILLGAPAAEQPIEEIPIQEGASKTLVLQFYGRDFDNTAPATSPLILAGRAATISISPRDNSIATATPERIQKDGLTKRFEFTITGKKVGMTGMVFSLDPADLNIRDNRPGGKEIKVNVVAAPDRRVGLLPPCGQSTTQVAISVPRRSDVENHEGSVGRLPNMFNAQLMLDNGDMYLRNGPAQLADMMGSVNCETGEFVITGNTGNRIPGYPNAPGRATGRFPLGAGLTAEGLQQAANAIEMTYIFGEGVFPGQPVEYDLVATPEVDSSACTYEIALDSTPAPFPGAFRSASVITDIGCSWTASSSADWLLLQGTERMVEGTGPASIQLRILTNPASAERAATLTVADASADIAQEGSAAARPVIDSVVNGASFVSGVSARSWLTIGGWNLAQSTRIWGDADFVNGALPSSLDGVSVSINGVPAYAYFVSPGQLNVLPDESVAGSRFYDVVVSNSAGSSEPYRIVALPLDPALFLFDPENRRYAAAVHADGTLLGKPGLFPGATLRPATGGDIVLLFGAGFGETDPPQAAATLISQPAPLARPVAVRIGGIYARVFFAGRISSGLYQLNVEIPAGLPPGDHLVEMFVDGVPIQPGVHITVE
ncbi:MAG: hypothetical protein R2748_22565 [Bryobacterales bacterium]